MCTGMSFGSMIELICLYHKARGRQEGEGTPTPTPTLSTSTNWGPRGRQLLGREDPRKLDRRKKTRPDYKVKGVKKRRLKSKNNWKSKETLAWEGPTPEAS